MPDVLQAVLVDGNNTGTPTQVWSVSGPNNDAVKFYRVDVRNSTTLSAHVTQVAGTTGVVFTFEVTTDPDGLTGWAAAANRLPGGGAYAATAITVGPGVSRSFFFDPTDNVSWVRMNITTQDGTKATARVTYEV